MASTTPERKKKTRRKSMDTPEVIAAGHNAAANAVFVNPNVAPSQEQLQQLRDDIKKAAQDPTRKTRRKSLDTPDPIAAAKNAANNAVFVNPNVAPSQEQLQQLRDDIKKAAQDPTPDPFAAEKYKIETDSELKRIHEKREWGVEIGVGSTALWIASMRKAESAKGSDAMYIDEFAKRFILDGGLGEKMEQEIAESVANFFYTTKNNPVMLDPKLKKYFIFNNTVGKKYAKKMANVKPTEELFQNSLAYQRMSVNNRVVHFDGEITRAVEDEGVKQMVTLGSGLDMRCLRLKCLQGGEVGGKVVHHYLIDQPDMIRHVKKVVPEVVEKPWIHYISCQFGGEKWWEKLTEAGFDPSKPSFFLVEGLVMYLQESEVDETLAQASKLMSPGSIMCGDYTLNGFRTHVMFNGFMEALERWKSRWTWGPQTYREMQAKFKENGFTILTDKDLLNTAGKFLTWVRDEYMPWIPNYRCYTICKGGRQGGGRGAKVLPQN